LTCPNTDENNQGGATMAAKRHHLAQRRKALGFTQEQLAARLSVDPTTVRRWESGETEGGPQPWLRPKLARSLQVSAKQLDELLSEGAEEPGKREPLSGSVSPHASDVQGSAELLNIDTQAGVFFPVIVNGRPVLVPFSGDIDSADWDAMSPLNRRALLSYGLAAATASALTPEDATRAIHRTTAPSTISLSPYASWATATYKAVLNPIEATRQATATSNDGGRDPQALRPVVDRVMRVSLSSDYEELERSLPSLIGQAEAAATQVGVNDHAAQQVLSDVYAVVGWTLIKADSSVGAWIAAQRAVQAAEQADDVLRIAAATRCLAEVHMRAGNFEEATRTAFLAAVHLETAAPEDRLVAISLRGAALLSAAAASARRGDGREAHAALKSAAACAAEVGRDRSDLATVFGPTNVAVHQVVVPIELGDAHDAVRHISTVQLDRMPKAFTERRSRFLIDVARSYAQMHNDSAAIDALLQAETIAADELRHHRLTRELVPQLLTREHRTSDLRALAGRCNLLA
jgi:DNA-binding XRE family transcriptional regulator